MKAKCLIVLGIRPDIINYQPLVKEMIKEKVNFKIVHTGQHYSYFFDGLFFKQLNFPQPDYHLKIGSGTQAQQLGLLVQKFENVLIKEKPDLVFSFSDANPALSGIVASKMGIKVVHLEAGMRSYDWRMPEEKNRRLLDSISDYLFTPTNGTKRNLIREGISKHRIFKIGKPIFEVLENFRKEINDNKILEELDLEHKNYVLVTAHRPENVSTKKPLSNILSALEQINKKYNKQIIFPMHPRTRESIKINSMKVSKGIKILDPIGFLEFSKLEKNAFCCVTDSGTVQEDACIFKVPCVTMRISTERSETVDVGSNIVAGINKNHILEAVDTMINRKTNWKNPYGTPDCSKQMIKVLQKLDSEICSPKVWWNHPQIEQDYSISQYKEKWKNPQIPDQII